MERDRELLKVYYALRKQLGRNPHHSEVYRYIFGDEETRDKIWNSATPKKEEENDASIHPE